MKIALIGYGKMGKAIEEVAIKKGHQICLTIDEHNVGDFNQDNVSKADVAIEFSSPHSAYQNVIKCLEFGVPVVCGSTGWLDRFDEAKSYCLSVNGALLYSSNYSIGVNIFFAINNELAKLMSEHPEYEPVVTEIHHTQKKDAPSGSAITIAQQILENLARKSSWVNHAQTNFSELSIISERIDPAPGTHKIKYSSTTDDIEIIHTAHNRMGFASGAVAAAEFIAGKHGIFAMGDVLGF